MSKSKLKRLKVQSAPKADVETLRPEPVETHEEKEQAVPKISRNRGPSDAAIARRKRYVRTPNSGRRLNLSVEGMSPDMVGRWVINDPGRVEPLMDRGYEPVKKGDLEVGDYGIEKSRNIGEVVTKRVGQGQEFVLMQTPREWYDADQRSKGKNLDEREAAIKSGHKNSEGVYGTGIKTDAKSGKGIESEPFRSTTD